MSSVDILVGQSWKCWNGYIRTVTSLQIDCDRTVVHFVWSDDNSQGYTPLKHFRNNYCEQLLPSPPAVVPPTVIREVVTGCGATLTHKLDMKIGTDTTVLELVEMLRMVEQGTGDDTASVELFSDLCGYVRIHGEPEGFCDGNVEVEL